MTFTKASQWPLKLRSYLPAGNTNFPKTKKHRKRLIWTIFFLVYFSHHKLLVLSDRWWIYKLGESNGLGPLNKSRSQLQLLKKISGRILHIRSKTLWTCFQLSLQLFHSVTTIKVPETCTNVRWVNKQWELLTTIIHTGWTTKSTGCYSLRLHWYGL